MYMCICVNNILLLLIIKLQLGDHQRPRQCLGSRLPPGAMWMSKGHAAVGSILVQIACHPLPWWHSDWAARTMFMSVSLPQPGSVLISVPHVAIKGCIDDQGLVRNLWPWGHLRAMLSLGKSWSEWHTLSSGDMVLSRTGVLQRPMSGSMLYRNHGSSWYLEVLLSQRAMWMTRAWSVTSNHVSVGELGCAWGHADVGAGAIELSGYRPLPKAISVSMAIRRCPWPSGVGFLAAVATDDAQGLISYLGPGWCLKVMLLIWRALVASGTMVVSCLDLGSYCSWRLWQCPCPHVITGIFETMLGWNICLPFMALELLVLPLTGYCSLGGIAGPIPQGRVDTTPFRKPTTHSESTLGLTLWSGT